MLTPEALVLEADYSTALTLLLRYPKPSASPSGFVKDALYLQKNLTVEGGRHIVFKYSRRKTDVQQSGVESTLPVRASRIVDAQAKPRRPSKTSNAKIRNSTRSPLPLPSPAKFFQEQGGVEGIIRGALGEMKKNVQFLQNGSPPRRGLYLPQSSVGDTQAVSSTTSGITSRIDALEQRNKALAKMLEDSLKGLWEHQKVATEDKSKIDVDALSLAIAKVQFVHVYLEDSAMPLPLQGESIHPSPESLDANTVPQSKHMAISGSETTAPKPASTASEDVKTAEPNVVSSDGPESTSRRTSRPQASGAPGIQPSPFQHPRPSLAQSSFSWMLGEDQRRTSFVAASRFPPEMKRGSDARGKTGFLFGDDKSQHGDGLESEAGTDHEEFPLGSLRAISDES